MIQNTNDIYKLIKSPMYLAEYRAPTAEKNLYLSYNLFHKISPYERIHIAIYDKYMEIYKYSHMNSEYYEYVRTTNKRGQKTLQRFKDILFAKNIAAMVNYVNSL